MTWKKKESSWSRLKRVGGKRLKKDNKQWLKISPLTILQKDASWSRLRNDASWTRLKKDASRERLRKRYILRMA